MTDRTMEAKAAKGANGRCHGCGCAVMPGVIRCADCWAEVYRAASLPEPPEREMTPLENRSPTFQQAYVCAFKDVIRWLHGQANSMNDPKAQSILNKAAFDLGLFKRDVAQFMTERAALTPFPPAQEGPSVAHAINELCDLATNGIQWLRNIRDGISTPSEGLTEMEENYARCLEISRSALAAHDAEPVPPQEGGIAEVEGLIAVLRMINNHEWDKFGCHDISQKMGFIADVARTTAAELSRLSEALSMYRDSVRVDATMEGPRFLGCNASALKRAWDFDRALSDTE